MSTVDERIALLREMLDAEEKEYRRIRRDQIRRSQLIVELRNTLTRVDFNMDEVRMPPIKEGH